MLKGRKVVPVCRICGRKIAATPRSLAGAKRRMFVEKWISHLKEHLHSKVSLETIVTLGADEILRTAFDVSAVIEHNTTGDPDSDEAKLYDEHGNRKV